MLNIYSTYAALGGYSINRQYSREHIPSICEDLKTIILSVPVTVSHDKAWHDGLLTLTLSKGRGEVRRAISSVAELIAAYNQHSPL